MTPQRKKPEALAAQYLAQQERGRYERRHWFWRRVHAVLDFFQGLA